ncbi:TPA: hypothetical protein ACGIK9_002802 [Acinetobacter baumannii]|uniref:hypothetical protein n=1 Tax=Acinetobacter baumannii TaxID=470 RepID=UPI00339002D2
MNQAEINQEDIEKFEKANKAKLFDAKAGYYFAWCILIAQPTITAMLYLQKSELMTETRSDNLLLTLFYFTIHNYIYFAFILTLLSLYYIVMGKTSIKFFKNQGKFIEIFKDQQEAERLGREFNTLEEIKRRGVYDHHLLIKRLEQREKL